MAVTFRRWGFALLDLFSATFPFHDFQVQHKNGIEHWNEEGVI